VSREHLFHTFFLYNSPRTLAGRTVSVRSWQTPVGVVACSFVQQCVSVLCSVLKCGVVCCSVLQFVAVCNNVVQCGTVLCNVVQCGAVWCSVVLCGAMWCCVL